MSFFDDLMDALGFERKRPEPSVKDEICDMVAALIDQDRDWEKGKHVWFHPTGVALWVGNEDYGLNVVIGAKDRNDYSTATDGKGVGLEHRHRTRLWEKVKANRAASTKAENAEKLQALAERVMAMYAGTEKAA